MTTPKKPIYTTTLTVRWRDLDAFGHVNNATYFTYFEQTRTQWWKSIGMSVLRNDIGPIVVSAYCDFLKAITEPTELLCKLYADPPGNSSYKLSYELALADNPNEPVAKGYTVVVWVDYQAGHSIPIPANMRKQLPQS